MDLTKEMWVAWQNDSVTKEVWSKLKDAREVVKETLASGGYTGDELQRAIGVCQGLEQVINVEPDWEEIENAKGGGE